MAWKNIFPLTETSRRLGYLPLKDKAWVRTPNLWWWFLMDRSPIPMSSTISLGSSVAKSSMLISEKLLLEAEVEWT